LSEGEQSGSGFLQVGQDFAALNPHLSLKMLDLQTTCSNPTWPKWTPADPIPAHWYSADRFDRLIGAHIADDQDNGRTTTVREFVATFRGMSATARQKAILESTGAARMSLSEFYAEGRNKAGVQQLLCEMQEATKPVKAADLGSIGRGHIEAHFAAAGAEMETFEYVKQTGTTRAGLPYVLEVAFAWCEDIEERRLITGLNFSPALGNPFRALGPYGDSLDEVLTSRRASSDEPIMVLVHLTSPTMSFTDRGKGQLVLDHLTGEAIKLAALTVTQKWCRTRKQEEKHKDQVAKRRAKMLRSRQISVKDAAYQVMEAAWLKASAGATLPAKARQVMYAARQRIQEITGKPLSDVYFTQTLLPDYVAERGLDWDIVWDDRGHFVEPHDGELVGLGTLNVRRYLAGIRAPRIEDGEFVGAKVSTHGPQGNFGAVLFCEKEGFGPLFERVNLGNRFDIAIMSTKGTSVTAARMLAERICTERGVPLVPLYILHDFDKSGLTVKSTLHNDTRRYRFKGNVQAFDIGLRLEDVRELGLESFAEEAFDKGSSEARTANLKKNGATEEEVKFLLHRRVELNALTSDQLIAFIERKLTQHGVRKVVPHADILAEAYRSNIRTAKIEEIIDRVVKETAADGAISIPDDLGDKVSDLLRKNPTWRWDDAVEAIADLEVRR
jgi:hypothetical protein